MSTEHPRSSSSTQSAEKRPSTRPVKTSSSSRTPTIRSLHRNAAALAGEAIARMDATFPWYRAMPAQHRSWVGVVAQNGITSFIDWYRHPCNPPSVSADVFRSAPREMARAVSLQQTVELVRTTIAVIEEHVEALAKTDQHRDLRDAVMLYSREVAFAAAAVYAQAAESRGAWDARMEALVVDALMRHNPASSSADSGLRSRAAALGWGAPAQVHTLVGSVGSAAHIPPSQHNGQAQTTASNGQRGSALSLADPSPYWQANVARVQRVVRSKGFDVLTGVHGTRLLMIVGCEANQLATLESELRHLANLFGPGPVVIGPAVEDLLQAGVSLAEAMAGLEAVAAWPLTPRPVHSQALLPERVLAGDLTAKSHLVSTFFLPLRDQADLLGTASVYLEQAGTVEATARQLFIHPNTVRYRLRRITDLTGAVLAEPRDSLCMRLALMLGRLEGTAG